MVNFYLENDEESLEGVCLYPTTGLSGSAHLNNKVHLMRGMDWILMFADEKLFKD